VLWGAPGRPGSRPRAAPFRGMVRRGSGRPPDPGAARPGWRLCSAADGPEATPWPRRLYASRTHCHNPS